MSNIWATRNKVFNKPNRNVFDHSFQNNLTMKQGYLTPVFCKEVLPGDSVRIGKDTMAAFNMLPMTFPVQTRMKLNTHFFYVRNRTLWKDFPDFFTNSKKDLISPYIDFRNQIYKDMLRKGSLLDYLNIPTTVVGNSFSSNFNVIQFNTAGSNTYMSSLFRVNPIVDISLSGGIVSFTGRGAAFSVAETTEITPSNLNDAKIPLTSSLLKASTLESLSSVIRSLPVDAKYGVGKSFVSGVASTPCLNSTTKSDSTVRYINIQMPYKIEDQDIISDGSLSFTINVPRWICCGQSADPRLCFVDTGRAFADALAKLSHVYLSATSVQSAPLITKCLAKFDFSLISVEHTDYDSVVRLSIPLTNELRDSLVSYSSGGMVQTVLNFITIPILGNRNYSGVASGAISYPLPNLSKERNFGFLVRPKFDSTIDSTSLGYFPYGSFIASTYTANSSYLIRSYARTKTSSDSVDLVNDYASSPYYDSVVHPDGLKVSSLPLRAYEFIYNAFYRDSRNNPFMIDGVPEYNKYLKSDDGGVETNEISFYRRNWEADHLTTACTTPQLGDAPLIGITASGVASFKDVDGVTHEVQLITSPDDGDTITSWKTSDVPNSVQRTLVNLATSGVSISDFRNVNALQRWLELNLRAGIRYKDVIQERWGMNTRFDDALLPEFLGGFSTSIDVNMISNTNGDGKAALGDYAGQGSCFGKLNHNISCVCDEPGFIIGIASITPTPVYSQLLPKHFLKSNVLDYFQPEFGNISLQPITYSHVCPVEAKRSGLDFGTVFGYQRAWWEYLSSTDEVHGLFRGNLRNFLVNRVFSVPPALNPDFLAVDPETVNDIFVVDQSVTDPFLGQFRFDVSMKRPIPRYGIPQIEDAATTSH